jgi:hypothetical protein
MELQCCISQQERVAHLLIETFGDKLYVGNRSSSVDECLPSPNDLRGKIIIKVRERMTANFSRQTAICAIE